MQTYNKCNLFPFPEKDTLQRQKIKKRNSVNLNNSSHPDHTFIAQNIDKIIDLIHIGFP